MVGLGNVWRFPYLCYKNGGGVFLIIYITTMIFCGLPIVLQEVVIGQYLGEGGSIIIGKICPILKGVGMSTMVMVTYYNIYYCVIISWSMYYFIASFTTIPDVPWNTCRGWWNSPNCWSLKKMENGSTTTNLSDEKVASVIEFWKGRVFNIDFVVITKNKSGGTLPPILWATETNVFFNKRTEKIIEGDLFLKPKT